MSNLARMQEISKELATFSELFQKHSNNTYTVFGNTLTILYDANDIEIAIGKIENKVEPHTHPEYEHYICLSGELTVYIDGQEPILLYKNDHCSTPPNIAHSIEADGSELLVIRIPSSGLMR